MNDIELKELEGKLDEAVQKGELTRRDALKAFMFMSTIGTAEALFGDANATDANKSAAAPAAPKVMASAANAKVVIVGGGSGGITVAARLVKADINPANITIIEPSEKHIYQPGQTLVAAGVMKLDDLIRDEQDYVPSGVNWKKTKVAEFMPETNTVKLANGESLTYDYLVVSAGLQYHYEKITGLTAEMIGTNDIHSIYIPEKAPIMWEAIQNFKAKTALFTNPSTPIKCGGAPQKIMYLTEDYLRQNGKREGVNINFMTAAGKYFGVPAYHEAVVGFVKEKGINTSFNHNLVELKAAEKVAIFEKKSKVKKFDPELKEDVEVEQVDKIEAKYDFIHVVPPMSPVDVVAKSPLANAKGWMHVDAQTLISLKFPNVFGLGDNVGTPFGKTGGSARKQAPVVVENMVAVMNGKEMTGKYNGYTVCPLITRYGRVMLAEFGYDKEQIEKKEPVTKAMAMPSFPLDPAQERWIWWILKVYFLPPMYWHGMLRGRM